MKVQFHLALPCKNIEETRKFYKDIIRAKLGRNTENWLDIDLYGNQLTFSRSGQFNFEYKSYKLDDFVLPSFHFGVIVPVDTWSELYGRLFNMDLEVTTEATFMRGRKGEHLSFFVQDPNGYMLEFKSFIDPDEIFSI